MAISTQGLGGNMAKKDGAAKRTKSERFEVEDKMSPGDVAGYLEGIAHGLREGSIVLGEQGESFRVAIAGDIELEVAARHAKRRSRIDLKLRFRRHDDEDTSTPPRDAEAPAASPTIPDEMSF
jgi:amphi-Trp domain-containing protein